MSLLRRSRQTPLWKEEFPTRLTDERYVARRQFAKFLVLTSLGMFVGNLWILIRSWLTTEPVYPMRTVAYADEIPVGGVKLFHYPEPDAPCIMIRTDVDTYVAYSQQCTHLSCAVFYAPEHRRLECPCHEGYFSVQDGRVMQGPPPRPLPRVILERRASEIVAVGIDLQTEG
jgi:Rieske Fe-S protein